MAVQLPEESIYLITTTVQVFPADELRDVIRMAATKRGEGKRTEIVFQAHELTRRGLDGQMQDLLELSDDLLGDRHFPLQ